MGQIVPFPVRDVCKSQEVSGVESTEQGVFGPAEILLFTGVRYERYEDVVTVSECEDAFETNDALDTASCEG
ncbi:MAG: hypothetical protein AAFV45_06365 [Pseudomonadota bacterium]